MSGRKPGRFERVTGVTGRAGDPESGGERYMTSPVTGRYTMAARRQNSVKVFFSEFEILQVRGAQP